MRDRLQEVRGKLWSVYVTLVSIVVALALENLVGQARTMGALWEWQRGSLLTWLQAILVFLMALNFWIMSTYLALALRWDISVRDAAGSLLFLFILNGLIATMGPAAEPTFFWIFGVGNTAAGFVILDVLHRSDRLARNGAFLARFRFRRGVAAAILMVGIGLGVGLLVQLGAGGLALATAATAAIIPLSLWILGEFSASWWQALGRPRPVAQPRE